MAFKREFVSLIFVYLKKHKCPKCSTTLNVEQESVVVNSKSPEAKNYDFSNFDTFMLGDVKFINDIFACPGCGNRISIEEMKRIEKSKDKRG